MIYTTADLHGFSLRKFKRFLNRVGFNKNDILYILGDVIDRGEDSVKLLEWIMSQPNVRLILGNHEAMMLECEFLFDSSSEESVHALDSKKFNSYYNWISNGGEITLNALRRKKIEYVREIFAYLRQAPLYEKITVSGKEFLLTHSGIGCFEKTKSLSEYVPHDFLWNRPPLETEYYEDIFTVFGHTPTVYYSNHYKGKAIRTRTWIDIDVGAAMGLQPMLFRLDDMQELYF